MKKVIISAILLIASALSLNAQLGYYYYGKNKVMKKKFHWKYAETENFKIHYYTDNTDLIRRIGLSAEKSYRALSDYLNIKVKQKIPLIFYKNHIDFEQTNITSYVPMGALAFAEPMAYRVVIQGDSSFKDLAETIQHELGHIFEYTLMGNRVFRMRPPLWLMEGFSDFITFDWDEFSLLTVRDAVINNQIPKFNKYGQFGIGGGRAPYDFGHLIFEFVAERHGATGVRKLIRSIKGSTFFRRSGNALKILGYTHKTFNYEFGKYLRKRFKKYRDLENPEDYSFSIGPEFPFIYSFYHKLSPSGELMAVLTVNRKSRDLDIILLSVKDGKVIKNITPGYTSKYDGINLKFNPKDGSSFAWNRDSDRLAFFARKELDYFLITVDVLNGKILQRIKMPEIHDPSSPVFHPTKDEIYFTALKGTNSPIYKINLKTEKAEILTHSKKFIKALDISNDGKRIVYSAKETSETDWFKLYAAPLTHPDSAVKITDGEFNDITPSFSEDAKKIYYSSNDTSSYNVCTINSDGSNRQRFTNVSTGNFFPSEIPGKKNQVIISSYFNGIFQLFKLKLEKPVKEVSKLDPWVLDKPVQKAVKDFRLSPEKKYSPLSKLHVKSLSPVAVSIGTDGRFLGYSYLTMSDLMGDHNFSLMLINYYGYQSYHFYYVDQSRRLQPVVHLFLNKSVYYRGYNYNDYLTVRETYGGEIGFYYPFNRSYRAEATVSFYNQKERSDLFYGGVNLPYGQYFDGKAMPVKLSLVGETTGFMHYGPNRGHTFKLSYSKYLPLSDSMLDAYSITADVRKYVHIDNHTLLAFRAMGFYSGGKNPILFWTGGDNTIRAKGYSSMVGSRGFVFNAEFRFTLVHALATPIGIMGPIRGTFFFDLGAAWFKDQDFDFFVDGDGLRLKDPISSYGFGLQFFFFGYPMHFDWIFTTDWKNDRYHGFKFWIGFDF